MTRTRVAMDDDMKALVDMKAIREGVPMTEGLRRALLLSGDEEGFVDKLLAETSGLWKGADGLQHEQALRDEWPR